MIEADIKLQFSSTSATDLLWIEPENPEVDHSYLFFFNAEQNHFD